MTDPITGAILWGQIAGAVGAAGAGAAAASAFSDSDTPEAPKGPDANAMPDLPKAPTQAIAPGSDKTQAEYDVQRARDAERRRAGMRQGRSNTILTGSLGLSGGASTSKKTLLGE